jgi:hypothetical protein
MSKLSNSSSEFFKKHPLGKSSVIRGIAAILLSAGTGIGVVYLNYHSYWKVTIYRTQTVDFNMLANLLPSKVSTHLLKNDSKGLQEVLDTNYGLFGTIVTNCKSLTVDCPEQKIIYGSKIKIEQISDTKQRLVPQGKYAHVWAQKFNGKDTPAHSLKGSDYIILRNPPTSKPDWKFESPRDSQIMVSQQQNINPIIGRIYFVRGNPPSFIDELKTLNPFSKGSRNLVYDAIAGAALLTGILAWLLSEIFHYRSRKSDRLEIEAERSIRQASEQLTQANIDKFQAEKDARLAQTRAEETAQRLKATNQEKLQAEKDARLAQTRAEETAQRLEVVNQEKLQAEEDARLAQTRAEETAQRLEVVNQEKLQAEEDTQYLYESVKLEEISYKELKRENKELQIRINELEQIEIDDNAINENITFECRHVCEALTIAGKNFTILKIWDDAYNSASNIDYYLPKRIYIVLKILAEVGVIYFEGNANQSFIDLLNQRGVRCSGESPQTMRDYGDERVFHHRGESKQMENHIKVGRKLRIYFDIDRQNKQIAIGYCGKHLRTVTG